MRVVMPLCAWNDGNTGALIGEIDPAVSSEDARDVDLASLAERTASEPSFGDRSAEGGRPRQGLVREHVRTSSPPCRASPCDRPRRRAAAVQPADSGA